VNHSVNPRSSFIYVPFDVRTDFSAVSYIPFSALLTR
jgi:hypothetical protein